MWNARVTIRHLELQDHRLRWSEALVKALILLLLHVMAFFVSTEGLPKLFAIWLAISHSQCVTMPGTRYMVFTPHWTGEVWIRYVKTESWARKDLM